MSTRGINRLLALAAALVGLAAPLRPAVAGTASGTFTVTKTVSGDFVPGGEVFYVFRIDNTTSFDQEDNPGDELIDILPVGITVTNLGGFISPHGLGVIRNFPEIRTITFNGNIPAGGYAVVSLNATIAQGTGGVTMANQGTLHFDADGDGTNESSRRTDDPGTPTADDPTVFVVAGGPAGSEIPTLGEVGLGALAASLAGAALVLMRRRRISD